MVSNTVQCELCPRGCELGVGERGNCRARYNRDGKLVTLVYGKPCAVHVDPIEKKPMFHFLPGTDIFSVATAGCNLHCKFCQNWEISQRTPEETNNVNLPPDMLVAEAVAQKCPSIAYTYSDPVIFYEYAVDSARLAKKKGLKNIWVTAGYINEKPLREACESMDGANVDYKGSTDDFYRDVCFAHLKPVQETIKTMLAEGVIVEVTNLIVPTLNDKKEMIADIIKWMLDNVGPDIPMHFSRFTPMYKLTNLYPTPAETLFQAAEMAYSMGMHYVYVGNVPSNKYEDTTCPSCKKPVIKRHGYQLLENHVSPDGKCAFCSAKIYGKWR